jgi:hypothetical protein
MFASVLILFGLGQQYARRFGARNREQETP